MNEFEKFYEDHLKQYGVSARGVGWKNEEAQIVRFEQLIKIINREAPFSVNDLGCGVGNLLDFFDKKGMTVNYQGYDILPQMIDHARGNFKGRPRVEFRLINDVHEMEMADYTIASGIFNIRFGKSDNDWLKYILDTLNGMNEKTNLGFAFNVLTKYSDKEYTREDLYYADPCFLFDYCKRNFSKNVALLHDYNQYDFTILVKRY